MTAPEPAASPADTEGPASAAAETELAGGKQDLGSGKQDLGSGKQDPGSGKQDPGSGRNDPQLPWEGRPRAVDIACWAGIALSGVYYLLLLPFRAALVGTHPLLLELLNGSTEAIVVSAAFARVGHGTLAVVLLAAIPGLMKFDLLYWWAGRLWGERVLLLMPGRRKRGPLYLARVQRWGRTFMWPAVVLSPFLPVPNALIYAIAGTAGMRLVTFIILDIAGTLLWAGMLAGLGYALGRHAVVVAQVISHYALWFTLAFVALIIISQVRQARAPRGTPVALPAADQGSADQGNADQGNADQGNADAR